VNREDGEVSEASYLKLRRGKEEREDFSLSSLSLFSFSIRERRRFFYCFSLETQSSLKVEREKAQPTRRPGADLKENLRDGGLSKKF